MKFSPKQDKSLSAIAAWLADPKAKQTFYLAGVAGCLGHGTPVLMFDGSIKRVEEISVGDRLMGPDSSPRTVLELCRGRQELFRIEPVKGEPWVCNASHVMTLTGSLSKQYIGKTIDISLEELLSKPRPRKGYDSIWKLWRTHVDFAAQPDPLPIDPYLAGVWLGDGHKGVPRITNKEPEILDYCQEIARRMHLELSVLEQPKNHTRLLSFRWPGARWKGKDRYDRANPVASFVRGCVDERGDKMIPRRYLVSARHERLALLAGLIDTDGYLTTGCYEYVTESPALRDGILFLARSLGFAAYSKLTTKTIKSLGFSGTYHRISISGDTQQIPCLVSRRRAAKRQQVKRVNVTGWTPVPIGVGDYYGFVLDKDGRFLLGDFTVTHNSGKSTLVEHIVKDLKGKTCFVAPTGKAALVMRRKGCPTATTVHKAIYRPAGDPPTKEQIEKLREECKRLYAINDAGARATADKLVDQLRRAEEDRKRQGPRFSLNLDSELRECKLGVVDEASMIDARMGADLESFGTKLLVIGDPAQLPPVYGAGYFTSREPDAFLDEIHRQALDSPILRLADLARQGKSLPYGQIGDGVDVRRYGDPSLEDRALKTDMILVGRNRTRHACNTKIRRLLGRANEPAPVPGDRAICLRNNHDLGLLNGSTWTVERCLPNMDRMTAQIEVQSTEDRDRVECSTWLHPFMAREDELNDLKRRDHQEFAFSWAITTHKSQGSAWNDVLVFDESRQFGKDAHRHLYTSITRAIHTLTVVV